MPVKDQTEPRPSIDKILIAFELNANRALTHIKQNIAHIVACQGQNSFISFALALEKSGAATVRQRTYSGR
jgi:hypothetical protein